MTQRILALLLALLCLCGAALAEDAAPEVEENVTLDSGFPELNEEGFLDEGEYVFEDPENGVWRYASATLKVEIFRRTQKKPNQVWYEAEVWSRDEGFRLIANNPEKQLTSQDYPYKIARKNQTVLAINTDYAQLRKSQKIRMGVIIRNGKVYSEVTWRQGASKFPNLDVLALYPDGNMEVYYSDEKKAEEYLEMGVESTLAFGPWLIRDGEMNTKGLKKYGTSSAQRTAIGMVEKGHYFAMMLEGRRSDAKGAGISFLAERMKEKGCTLAFNLDGGQTSSIVFMGRQICQIHKTKKNVSSRKTSEILGIGTSEQVRSVDDPW